MEENVTEGKEFIKHLAEQGDFAAKVMLKYLDCEEKICKIGEYIGRNQGNKNQLIQINEFLKSMNNLFDDFIKQLD